MSKNSYKVFKLSKLESNKLHFQPKAALAEGYLLSVLNEKPKAISSLIPNFGCGDALMPVNKYEASSSIIGFPYLSLPHKGTVRYVNPFSLRPPRLHIKTNNTYCDNFPFQSCEFCHSDSDIYSMTINNDNRNKTSKQCGTTRESQETVEKKD